MAGTLSTTAPTGNFTLGNQSPGPGHTDEIYTGGMAGVSVYTTALTSDQIEAQFDAATVPEPSSLALGFWRILCRIDFSPMAPQVGQANCISGREYAR